MQLFSFIGDLFHNVLYVPIINLLVLLYHAISFIHVPYALGFAIITLTIVIRLILYPLMNSQLKASKKMQDLNPHLKNLKEKHKNDAKMLQQETMRLYKEHGVNPAAGCLPVLIQLPLIWALYAALQLIVKPGMVTLKTINAMLYSDSFKLLKPWDANFFGLPLAQTPSHLISSIGPVILLVPVLTGLFQFIQSKMMFSTQPKPEDKKLAKTNAGSEKKKDEDFATAFQSQSMYIFPLMIGFFSWGFPIGLSLYWNTFTIFGIMQQYRISGLGGLKVWVDKIYVRNK
jgi:YidC/Oxa1 family membrane protein insertase